MPIPALLLPLLKVAGSKLLAGAAAKTAATAGAKAIGTKVAGQVAGQAIAGTPYLSQGATAMAPKLGTPPVGGGGLDIGKAQGFMDMAGKGMDFLGGGIKMVQNFQEKRAQEQADFFNNQGTGFQEGGNTKTNRKPVTGIERTIMVDNTAVEPTFKTKLQVEDFSKFKSYTARNNPSFPFAGYIDKNGSKVDIDKSMAEKMGYQNGGKISSEKANKLLQGFKKGGKTKMC